MTLAKSFDAWAQQHEQKGEAILLQRLLARRFGPLPAVIVAQIAAASVDEIELWCDRVLDAASLDDVFQA